MILFIFPMSRSCGTVAEFTGNVASSRGFTVAFLLFKEKENSPLSSYVGTGQQSPASYPHARTSQSGSHCPLPSIEQAHASLHSATVIAAVEGQSPPSKKHELRTREEEGEGEEEDDDDNEEEESCKGGGGETTNRWNL